jgi:hypothetical protein
MNAHPLRVRLFLAAAIAALGIYASPALSGASIRDASSGITPLPAGWELCILQGVGAPATQANVADLDQWQLAEGGSTNNSAAFNPFNTGRTTDVFNTPLPLTISANGFPAFTNWLAGCAATVATILQPNMATIAAGLISGDVSPPPAFLAVVDQSQWCAPSADGTPCYSDMIGGTTGSLARAVLDASSALDVYGNVQSDLHSYLSAVLAATFAQQAVSADSQKLSAAQTTLSSARGRAADAQAALRRFAINEYVSSGLYQSSSFVSGTNTGPFGTPSQDGVAAHQYATVVASDLLAQNQAATAAVKAALAHRDGVAKTLQGDSLTLVSDNGDENRSLVRLVADVTTLQNAGACTAAVITTPTPTQAPATSPAPSGATPPPTATPPSTSGQSTPTTTTPTVAPTTTTTSPTTTTTTAPGGTGLVKPVGTTTTVPGSTTTTTAPSSTTTTTTAPTTPGSGTATTPAPTPNPSGLQVLQGCVTALAPTAKA